MAIDTSEYWYFDYFDILDSLSDEEKVRVMNMSCRKNWKKKEVIYSEKDVADKLYFLKSGKIKVSRYSEDGKEMILSILQQGDVFGETSIISEENTKHKEVVEVLEDTLTCELSIEDVRKVLKTNLDFNQSILTLIGNRHKKVQDRLEALFFKSTPERIKGFIKEMADELGMPIVNSKEIEIKFNLKHEDIAKLTATTRQTVTSILNQLQKEGIILYDRSRILVKEYTAL